MMSNYYKDRLAKMLLVGTTFHGALTNVYLAFFSDNVNAAGTGTENTATICTTRPIVTFTFGAVGSGESTMAQEVITVENAATISSVGLFDAVSGGNLLFFHHLASPVSVVPGTWTIDAGDIKVVIT